MRNRKKNPEQEKEKGIGVRNRKKNPKQEKEEGIGERNRKKNPEREKKRGIGARNEQKNPEREGEEGIGERNRKKNPEREKEEGIGVRNRKKNPRILFSKGIPFRYEEKIILGNQILYPDFTIRHPKTGKLYYWEHFGMMDNPEYVNHACQKVKTYCDYGFIPSIHLLITYETKEQPLEIDRIERMVKEYFL